MRIVKPIIRLTTLIVCLSVFLLSIYDDAKCEDVFNISGVISLGNIPNNSTNTIYVYANEVNNEFPQTYAIADYNGKFSFPVFKGKYNLYAYVYSTITNKDTMKSSYCSFYYNLSSGLLIGADTEINVVVPSVLMSGMVTDNNNTPIPEVEIKSQYGTSVTGYDGRYEMILLPGSLNINVEPQHNSGLTIVSKALQVSDNFEENFILNKGNIVSGVITINNLPDDNYNEIRVYAKEVNGLYPQVYTNVDSNGLFSLPLPEGNYNFQVYIYTYGNSYSNYSSFYYDFVSNQFVDKNLEINIVVPSIILSGSVTDVYGAPISGVEITCDCGRAVTTSEGRYQIFLLPGDFSFMFSPPSNSGLTSILKTLTISSNTDSDIVMNSGFLLSGSVSINNFPQNSYGTTRVYATEINGKYPTIYTDVDENGRYSLGVLEGSYQLSVYGYSYSYNELGGYSYSYFYHDFDSNVFINSDTTKNLIVPTVLLSGIVTNIDGTPVSGAEISGQSTAYTGSDGRYQMLLLPGTLNFTVNPPSSTYPPFYLRDITIVSNQTRNIWFGLFDSDNDGYADESDLFPFNPSEWLDTDSDGKGNNADLDDDNDGMFDSWEGLYNGLDPLMQDGLLDLDNDGVSNYQEFLNGTDPTGGPVTSSEQLNQINPVSWANYYYENEGNIDSLFAFVKNCLNDPNHAYNYLDPKGYICPWIHREIQNYPIPAFTGKVPTITAYLDDVWDHQLSLYNIGKFNTVFKGMPHPNRRFEVISRVDDHRTPIDGTDNLESYFFTYDTRDDTNGTATDFDEWINYLKAVTIDYGRPIDTLTIFAHGEPGVIHMSGGFVLKEGEHGFKITNNDDSRINLQKLKNDGILTSCDSVILLFSCNVAETEEGKNFVQAVADWTGATVYANTQRTGPEQPNLSDWELDVIKRPSNYQRCMNTKEEPLRASDGSSFKFPGGLIVDIPTGSLTDKGGSLSVTDVTDMAKIETSNVDNLVLAWDISFINTAIADESAVVVHMPIGHEIDLKTVDTTKLSVKYWDVPTGSWSNLGIFDVNVNEDLDLISFKTKHTTIFGVFLDQSFVLGDLNTDGIVDRLDVAIITANRNKPASAYPECDLDGDGKITVLDARKLTTLCTYTNCASK